MAATLYAVLVGINEYDGGVTNLRGCVNDVRRMKEFLEVRTSGGDYELDALLLTSGDPDNPHEVKPTRKVVIDAFQSHLTKAGEGDIALFYYSGHGAQEKAPPEFWHIEPGHLDETIVCMDSRTEGGWDLADKELAVLIAGVAKKKPHLVVILDSCHSGSGTRAADGTDARLATTDPRDRPIESFIDGVRDAAQRASASDSSATEPNSATTSEWFAVPDARHIVLSGCRPEELSREKMIGNERRGIFSYHLLETLQQVGPSLTYRDLFSRVSTLVRNAVSDQSPVLAATESDDLQRPFLGGAIVTQRPYFDVRFHEDEWTLAAGAIHGIAAPVGSETTTLALFPLGQTLTVGDDLSTRLATATVRAVGGSESMIDVEDDALDPTETYKAVVVATPLTPIALHLSGDDEGALEGLRAALADSPIVRTVDDVAGAEIRIVAEAEKEHFLLKRAGDREPLAVEVKGLGSPAAAEEARAKAEHIAQWMQLLKLENKQSALPADAVTLELFAYDSATNEGRPLDPAEPIRLEYDPKRQKHGAAVQIRLRHTGKYKEKLFCMLVNMTESFSVVTDGAIWGSGVWLEPGEEAWAMNGGKPVLSFTVPSKLQNQGVTRLRDVLKLIVSTAESDATLLQQEPLDVVRDEGSRGLAAGTRGAALPANLLSRLMQRFPSRDLGGGAATVLSDWRTSQLLVTTTVVGAEKALPSDIEESVELADGVRLQGHAAFDATALLVPFDEGKRDLGTLALPALFRTHPELAPPFNFLAARGGDAGHSVVVLRDVSDPSVVTREAPLIFHADAPLGEGEAILPIAFDPASDLFLPLGIGAPSADGVEIRVERLPEPTGDSRDVKGSIKLFFQKVAVEKLGGERFGITARLTRLAAATMEDGIVSYDDSPLTLKQKVAAAKRIVLYVHGFTGDTRGMVASAYWQKAAGSSAAARLVDHYDLILAWDYESLNTPIAESALKLKADLAAVGLGADHGKALHVIVHSMGGPVTRWFVEREGGNRIVQKVVFVGSPHNGTPLATLQDYALIGLGAALNGLAALVWPPAAVPIFVGMLTSGVGAVEKVDVTADELKPGSQFFKLLNASDDPNVDYTLVAGNTSKIARSGDEAEKERELFKRLVEKLASPRMRQELLSLAFFNHPNDMVISVESMLALPTNRAARVTPVEVPCDHISYFGAEAGLRAIVEALIAPPPP